jgi:hypothetical protein
MALLSPPQTPAVFGAMRFGGFRFGYAPVPAPIATSVWTAVDPDSATPDTEWEIIFEHDP